MSELNANFKLSNEAKNAISGFDYEHHGAQLCRPSAMQNYIYNNVDITTKYRGLNILLQNGHEKYCNDHFAPKYGAFSFYNEYINSDDENLDDLLEEIDATDPDIEEIGEIIFPDGSKLSANIAFLELNKIREEAEQYYANLEYSSDVDDYYIYDSDTREALLKDEEYEYEYEELGGYWVAA